MKFVLYLTNNLTLKKKIRLSAKRVGDVLDETGKNAWKMRKLMEHVVLVDWETKESNTSRNTPIWTLRDIMLNVRFLICLKRSCFFY